MTLRRLPLLALLTLAAACAGAADRDGHPIANDPEPTPSESDTLTGDEAEALFDEAVLLALAGAPGATVSRVDSVVTLDGTVVLGGGDVTFNELALETRPFAPSGTASIVAGDHSASFLFAGSVDGSAVIDGESVTVTAAFPMTAEFAEAAADWALDVALNPNASFVDPCPNLTVTDNGNGSFTIDGDCAVGGATVAIDMVTIDLANMAIDGTITLDDGNNNTALIDFNGATVDVTVNGNLVLDDQPIFGFLGP